MKARDDGLERLLEIDGFLAEIGGGFWVKIVAQRIPPDVNRPHGVSYSLTLHEPGGRRVFGIDNAHPLRVTRGPPAGRRRLRIICIVANRCGRTPTVMRTHCSRISGVRSMPS